jgi:hypothetical protein
MQLTQVQCKKRMAAYLQKSIHARSCTCILAGHRGTCEYVSTPTRNCECEYRRTLMLPCGGSCAEAETAPVTLAPVAFAPVELTNAE